MYREQWRNENPVRGTSLIKYYLVINLVRIVYMPGKSLILLFQTIDGNVAYCTDFNGTCYY